MTLTKRNGSLFNNLPTLFNDFFDREFLNWGESNFSNTGTTIPAVNIRETKDDFVVEMAAPGMKKEDFKIELDGSLLSIGSERSSNQVEENNDERYSRREFSYESFQRSFTLPKDVVETDRLKARYENGVLRLEIPKKEEAKQKPPKLIAIS